MISQDFVKLLHDPSLRSDQNRNVVDDLVERYPYCQSGQILLACQYHAENDSRYPAQLKKAAAYAGDRKRLKLLISQSVRPVHIPVSQPAAEVLSLPEPVLITEPLVVLTQESYEEITLHSSERLTQEELLSIVKKRLAEITAARKTDQDAPGTAGIPPSEITIEHQQEETAA